MMKQKINDKIIKSFENYQKQNLEKNIANYKNNSFVEKNLCKNLEEINNEWLTNFRKQLIESNNKDNINNKENIWSFLKEDEINLFLNWNKQALFCLEIINVVLNIVSKEDEKIIHELKKLIFLLKIRNYLKELVTKENVNTTEKYMIIKKISYFIKNKFSWIKSKKKEIKHHFLKVIEETDLLSEKEEVNQLLFDPLTFYNFWWFNNLIKVIKKQKNKEQKKLKTNKKLIEEFHKEWNKNIFIPLYNLRNQLSFLLFISNREDIVFICNKETLKKEDKKTKKEDKKTKKEDKKDNKKDENYFKDRVLSKILIKWNKKGILEEILEVQKKGKGIKVAAVILQKEGENKESNFLLKSKICVNKKVNHKDSKNKENNHSDYKTHAEYLSIQELKQDKIIKNNHNLILVITKIPCEKCYQEIKKQNEIKEVYYLENKHRKNYDQISKKYNPKNKVEEEIIGKIIHQQKLSISR